MLIRFKLTSTGDAVSINPAAVSSVEPYGGLDDDKAKIHMINRDTHYVLGSFDDVTNTLNDTSRAKIIPTPIRTAAKRKRG